MKDVIYLLFDLLTTLAKLLRPGGSRTVIAENLLLKSNLTTPDRIFLGFLSLPHVPMSHPFVERLIGSVRRELLDQTLFWTATDLENKLTNYQRYYNEYRTHSGRNGLTPVDSGCDNVVDINRFRWKKQCRGLFQLPEAA